MGPVGQRTDALFLGAKPLVYNFSVIAAATNCDNTLLNAVTGSKIRVVGLSLVAGASAAPAFAIDWQNSGKQAVQPLYPYKDLPGVKAQPDKKVEESYACHTETVQIRRRHDEIFRSGGMPTLMYVCERDGVISMDSRVPLRGHSQPVR